MKRNEMDESAVEREDRTQLGVAEAKGPRCHRLEYPLGIGGRARDHAQDLGSRSPPRQRLRLAVQRLRQALLKIKDAGVFVLRRLARELSLGFDLRLRGLCTPTLGPSLLLTGPYERAAIDDRLGEDAAVGKRAHLTDSPPTPTLGRNPRNLRLPWEFMWE
jgi:hypothetical protein